MRLTRFAVVATTMVVLMTTALAAAPAASAVERLDVSKGKASFSFSLDGSSTATGQIGVAAANPCWAFQRTYIFGNAVADQGSGTWHIQWCANSTKTRVVEITSGQFWCQRGPYGFWTYDGCSKQRGTVPASRVSYHVVWRFHLTVLGATVNKTLSVDGYVYPDGRVTGTVIAG